MLARSETRESVIVMDVWSLVAGLLFAIAVWLVMAPHKTILKTVAALFIWLIVSGLMILLHEGVWEVRTRVSKETLARNQLRIIYVAGLKFADHCGKKPSEEQGLQRLGQKSWDREVEGTLFDRGGVE